MSRTTRAGRARGATVRNRRPRAFSLIELVIVVVILGSITALAIPRVMRGADNADIAALQADLTVLNKAVELYRIDHSAYPDATKVASQLIRLSDRSGTNLADVPAPASGIIYGPYVVQIPPLPLGPNAGNTGIATGNGAGVGWLYSLTDYQIRPNLMDGSGDIPDDLFDDLGIPMTARDDYRDLGGPSGGGPVLGGG